MKILRRKRYINIFFLICIIMILIAGCDDKSKATVANNVDKPDFKEKAINAYLKNNFLDAGKYYLKNTKEKSKEESFMYSDEIKLGLVQVLSKNQHFLSIQDMNNKGYYIKDIDNDNIPEIICANSLKLDIYKFNGDDFKTISLNLPSDIKSSCIGKITKDKIAIILSNYGDVKEETGVYVVEDEKIVKKLNFTSAEFTNSIVKDIDGDGIYEIGEITGDEVSKTINWNKINGDYSKQVVKTESMSNLEYIKLRNLNILDSTIKLSKNPSDEEILSFLTKALKYERAIYYLRDGDALEIDERPYFKLCKPVDTKENLIKYYNNYFSRNFINNSIDKFYKFKDNVPYVLEGDAGLESVVTKVISKTKSGDNLKITIQIFDGSDKGSIECSLVLENGEYKIDSGEIFI
ncbi:IseA DL-endopeptidase inhibitor [Clostridium cavendishii DSM 21758]|uniref:IseA DL-endopeptidase inhibitor n=1 Tax=Clostridium cavendishii DSM 21758 TaxID=1121302 RepID=A0A1M6AJ96_9CLOT|nr:DL-endopeptidase inhibitor IseA family protein [Clostridium cavendishii]SHI36589.1 IseA DL-endopeptidase inhibitor [Clostridium cavendishii DSM 21758]